jgi:oligosaccharide repeat unit polymerase
VVIIGFNYQLYYKRSKVIYLLIFVSFIATFFHGQKSSIIYPVFACAFSFLIRNRGKPIPVNLLLGLGLILVVAFQIVTVGRELPYLIGEDKSIGYILTYRLDYILVYALNGYTNLQEELLWLKHLRLGAESFQFIGDIFKFLAGTREVAAQTTFEGEGFYLYNISFNTGTFAREHFRDFGYLGCFLFSLCYGVLATFFYRNYSRAVSPLTGGIYECMQPAFEYVRHHSVHHFVAPT